MSDYQQQNQSLSDDPAASTQMFRAFVDEAQPTASARSGGSGRGAGLVIGVIVAVVIVAAVAYLALK